MESPQKVERKYAISVKISINGILDLSLNS